VEYYLKLNVKIEPLSWQWYSWPYLISPATAACNIAERHIQIMESYISMPEIHAQAVNNPELLGGPYVDLNGEYVEEIEELKIKTEQECAELIELNNSLKKLDQTLQKEYKGKDLASNYNIVPENIKGLVELVYDLNNNPSIRLIEGLLYKKYEANVVDGQSISLSIMADDYRPFVLSTPYIERSNELNIKVALSDKKIDELVSLRSHPKKMDEILDIFKIPDSKIDLFKSFFTTTPPVKVSDNEYMGDEVRIRYFGHACVLLQVNNLSILIDPVISYDFETTISRFSFKDLPEHIDYLLISHNHQDHILIETLIQLKHKVRNVIFPQNNKGFLADPSLKLILGHLGFKSLISLDDFETFSIPYGQIISLPFLGEHSDLNIQSKSGYFINLKDKKFVMAADSNNLEPKLYERIFSYIGPIDMLFIGMECDGAPLSWLYGPLLSSEMDQVYDNSRTLSGSNFEKAWALAEQSQCKYAYVYAMGQEPWLNYIMALKYNENSIQITESNKFLESCVSSNIVAERLFGKKEWFL
jgi:L-ascorbate metabolism protein UlaG (beta-lactamase superfamily)